VIAVTASPRAAGLLTRLRAVWPEPVPLTMHRAFGGGAGTSYLVLPSLRRPVLLVPADSAAAATAFRRVDDGQRAWAGWRVLAWAQQHRLLRLLPVGRVRVGDPEASGVVAAVRAAVPDTHTMVVRLGRPRHGRAVVLQALAGDGRSLAFAKCAFGSRTADLRSEHAALAAVGSAPAAGVRAPRVLGFDDSDGQVVLVLEALVPTRPSDGAGVPAAAMRALADRIGSRSVPVSGAPVVARLRAQVDALSDQGARRWLMDELDRLVADLGDVPIRCGDWHGDWVGWNMAREGDTVLLWDWEHHETGVPRGLDHVHHLAQDLRVRLGTSAAVEDRWLIAAEHALADDWGIRGDAAQATLRIYLLVVNLRYVEDREGDPRGPARRDGWSRSLLARMGANRPSGRAS